MQAQAAIVDFACPTGGGTYRVNSGSVTGTSGTCSGDLTLDSSVTTLGGYAFGSAQLSSLTIPATVTTISGSTFGSVGNRSLVSVTVDSSNPNYSSSGGVLFNKAATELLVYPASKPGTSYTIPSSVTSIRYYGFSENKFLTSIHIPNTVTALGGQDFYNSKSLVTITIGTGLTTLNEQGFSYIQTLTAINVDASNTSFASIDGVLYSKNISTLWAYPIGKTATSYTAPNTVTSTKYTVFGGARNLITVDLTSVTTLSGQEFMDATSVREITFGNSLTQLKSQTLQSTSDLRKLFLGTGLTSIVDGAFYDNARLSCVIYAGSNSTIQNYAYPNGVVPVASSSSCLADPAFTLSSSTESVIAGTAITGYTVSSTGGAIASYSISPAISSTPGLAFSTSTGVISGTPTTVASARTYTITATNAANTATQTFAITVNPAAPAFTLSSATISATTGVAITSYTVSSTGGTVASYSISPAISNTPGLSFSTSTGRISGTPTAAASARTYTITATNVTSTATRDFAITVNDPAPEYVAPEPVPYLKTLTTPKMNLKDGKLMCTQGTYNAGYTLDGVIQGSTTTLFTPTSFTYNLLINGITQTSLAVTSSSTSHSWTMPTTTSGALITCSVTVTANGITNTDKSGDNTSGASSALATQSAAIAAANATYSAALRANTKAYQKALVDNRTQWRSTTEKIRTDYYAERNRINSLPSTKATRALSSAALKAYTAALKKSAADYKASGPAALAAKDVADKAALDAKSAAITKADAAYGTAIESIGFGVLIP